MKKVLFYLLAIGCICLTSCGSKEMVKNEAEVVEKEVPSSIAEIQETQDENSNDLETVLEEKLPYISFTNAKLGINATDYMKSTSDTLVSIDQTGITASYYLKDDDTIDYYMDNNQRYIIGVSNDEILVYVISATECVGAGIQVKDVLNGLDADTTPYDIKVDTNYSLYLWRIDGGYLAIHVANVGNTSYLDKYVNDVVYISDPEYHDVLHSFMSETENVNDSQEKNMKNPDKNSSQEFSIDSATDEEITSAVIHVYEEVCKYMNNAGQTDFDTNDLKIMYENWDIVKNLDLFEKPIEMEEYIAMRQGQTVSFYYDAGVQLVWGVESDTVDIIYNED